MSARATRQNPPHPLGQNFTQPHVARAIVDWASRGLPAPASVLEPSAGTGVFVRAIIDHWPSALVRTIEPDVQLTQDYPPEVLRYNGTLEEYQRCGPPVFDLAIGNPPYSLRGSDGKYYSTWEGHVELARSVAQDVVFLLRVNVLGGVERALSFWKRNPPAGIGVVVPRPSFQANGATDATEYAAFVWSDRWTGTDLHIHAPRPKKAAALSHVGYIDPEVTP